MRVFRAVVVAGAFAITVTPVSGAQAPPHGIESDELALARITGEQLRRELPQGFKVHYSFLAWVPYEIERRQVAGGAAMLEAFRAGAGAAFLDSAANSNPDRARQLSASDRYYRTLTGPPIIKADSASVDVLSSGPISKNGEFYMSIMRYVFVRDPRSGWRFVRRELGYSI